MARCPFDQLSDLSDVLAKIRLLRAVREEKPGIFYIGSQSFLHFHIQEARRWADVRDGKTWSTEIDLPMPISASAKKTFLAEVLGRYERSVKPASRI